MSVSALVEKAQVQQHLDAAALSSPASPTGGSAGAANGIPAPVDEEGEDPGRQQDELDATPPPYSGPSSSTVNVARPAAAPRGPQRHPGLPRLDYRLYSPPLFELSADCTTIKSTAPYLSANATALVGLIRAQSTVPPKPQVHVTGTRGRKVDFAVKLNLMNLLIPEDARKRMDYICCVADDEVAYRGGYKPSAEPVVGEGGLEEWCRRFVEDPGPIKSFTLERVVANLDANWLEGQIRTMIASTGYSGNVAVTFPVTHAKVVVQSPDRVNKFFTSVATLFAGKRRYEVARAVWPFATHRAGDRGRRCTVQSEETWWREWRDPLKYAIATKRQGWVTNEDKLEALMEGVGKGIAAVDWGPEY